MNLIKLTGANYFAAVSYDTKKVTDAPLKEQPRDAFHIVAMSTNALPHIEAFLQDLKDQRDHAIMMTKINVKNITYMTDIFSYEKSDPPESHPLYSLAKQIQRDLQFAPAGVYGRVAFNRMRMPDVLDELSGLDENNYFNSVMDNEVIVVFKDCSTEEALSAIKRCFTISGSVWCMSEKKGFNAAIARMAVDELKTRNTCSINGYTFYVNPKFRTSDLALRRDVWLAMGGHYVELPSNLDVNIFDESSYTPEAKAELARLDFIDTPNGGRVAYYKGLTNFILSCLRQPGAKPMISTLSELTMCGSKCTATEAADAIANDLQDLAVTCGRQEVTIDHAIDVAKKHFFQDRFPPSGEFSIADSTVKYSNWTNAGEAVVATIATMFGDTPMGRRISIGSHVPSAVRRKIYEGLMQSLKHSPVVDVVLHDTRVVAYFEVEEHELVKDALYKALRSAPMSFMCALKVFGDRRGKLVSEFEKLSRDPANDVPLMMGGTYRVPTIGGSIVVRKGVPRQNRLQLLIEDWLDEPSVNSRVYVHGTLTNANQIPDILNAYAKDFKLTDYFKRHGVFVAYAISPNERAEGHAALLNKLNAMKIANTEPTQPAKPDAGTHYTGYHSNGEQWFDTMKQTRFQDPVRMEAAIEINVRKYLDRLGRKDNKIQELTKAAKYLVYWILYLKTNGKATFDDVNKIFENI